MSIRLRVGGATDQGQVRSINQDSFRLRPERDLFIVADGMGGHQGGEVAAQMAVELIDEHYDDATPHGLQAAILAANTAIFDRSVDDADLRGMGTTAVVAALVQPEPAPGPGGDDGGSGAGDDDGDRPGGDRTGDEDAEQAAAGEVGQQLLIANVGDSRAYVYRDDELIQLTEDHSMVADLVRQGRISQDEADNHPQRNIVTRVLGVYEHIEVDLWPVDPVTGDRFLLCSDGLFNEVGADAIGAVLRRLDDPTEAATELIRLANEGGGRDNITVVVVDVLDDDGAAGRASAALGRVGHESRAPDLAGFSSADTDADATQSVYLTDDDAGEVPTGWRSRRSRRRAERAEGTRTRFTWRVVLFVALILAVLGGAWATIVWYGTSTYFVGFDEEEVVIYRGRPGGLLWIDPTVEERTPIAREDVPTRYVRSLEDGREQPTLDDARRVVENIRRDAGLDEDGQPTTTTTSTTTTTTEPDDTTTTTAGG